MSRRRRRSSGPARCRSCRAPIVFLGSPFTGKPRPFDPRPVDPAAGQHRAAYPVMGRTAYKPDDLVEVLLVQLRTVESCTEAEEEIRDLPWHSLHDCEQLAQLEAERDTSQPPDEPRKEPAR